MKELLDEKSLINSWVFVQVFSFNFYTSSLATLAKVSQHYCWSSKNKKYKFQNTFSSRALLSPI